MIVANLSPPTPAYISVFAGRIADTGRDPMPHMVAALEIVHQLPNAELIWASPREVLNVYQAAAVGCGRQGRVHAVEPHVQQQRHRRDRSSHRDYCDRKSNNQRGGE